jgi:hypothetical protein
MVKTYRFLLTMKPKQRQAESLKLMHQALSPSMRSMSFLQAKAGREGGRKRPMKGAGSASGRRECDAVAVAGAGENGMQLLLCAAEGRADRAGQRLPHIVFVPQQRRAARC